MKKILAAVTAAAVLLTLTACSSRTEQITATAENTQTTTAETTQPAPLWEWQHDSPDNQGLNSGVLDDIHSTFDSFDLLSSVIVKNGYIVDEYYKEDYDGNSLFLLHSASKSITSALVGIAIDKGYIESVDTPIAEYFPQLAQKDDPRWSRITVRHLLTHTSGIDCGDTEFEDAWRASDNWIEFVLSRPMAYEPGEVFNYSTGNTHLLTAILEQATGMTELDFGMQYLFEPMDIENVRIDTDAQGVSDGGNGIWMTPYDMAKIGLLYMNGGVWEGEQLIPQQWIEDSTSVQYDRSTGSADYGYQWWVRTFGDDRFPAFFAQGHAGQYIFVVPQIELIVVFTGDYTGRTSIYWRLENDIVNACS